MNGFAERIIRTITEMAHTMMIHSQTPIQYRGAEVNTAVYLHQSSPNKVVKRNDCDGYKVQYEMP